MVENQTKFNHHTFHGYPEVSLAEARTKATELRLQIRNGIDPIRHKQEQQ